MRQECGSHVAHPMQVLVNRGDALRQAKLTMRRRFGPEALPKLWSGVLMYGDSAGRVTRARQKAN